MNNAPLALCIALNRAHASLRLRLDDELGAFHGIDLKDFVLLDELARAEGNRVALRQLVRPVGLSRSALLRQLTPLEKIGLLARSSDGDTREVVLRPAGRVVTEVARETVGRIATEAMASLSSHAIGMTHATLMALAESPTLALD